MKRRSERVLAERCQGEQIGGAGASGSANNKTTSPAQVLMQQGQEEGEAEARPTGPLIDEYKKTRVRLRHRTPRARELVGRETRSISKSASEGRTRERRLGKLRTRHAPAPAARKTDPR